MLRIIKLKTASKINRIHNTVMGFSWISEYEITFGYHTCFGDRVYTFSNTLFANILTHRVDNTLATRFNTYLNHPTSGLLHKSHHIRMKEVCSGTATPGERQLLTYDSFAYLF